MMRPSALKPNTLGQWLAYQQTIHKSAIDLGLDRVCEVGRRLKLNKKKCPVITIAGTNGKGSCVAMMESILIAAGYNIGSYTSPHLLRYNERVRINLKEVSDDALCEVFACVDKARGEISLSYFEFGTLAALRLFDRHMLDAIVLEVGLGGRLDAVNIRDPDLAIITSIGHDHVDWLGTDRESIGFEKAGIMRPAVSVICGDPDPPRIIASHADKLRAPLFNLGVEFGYVRHNMTWDWHGPGAHWCGIALPSLKGEMQLRNAATTLMGLVLLSDQLPVDRTAINLGLKNVSLPGRFQRIAGLAETILDVAHNPESAESLAATLRCYPITGRTHAVFAVLSDKDAVGIVEHLGTCVDSWYLAEVESKRALSVVELANLTKDTVPDSTIRCFPQVQQAYVEACQRARPGDRVLVFGSVHTVASVLALLDQDHKASDT